MKILYDGLFQRESIVHVNLNENGHELQLGKNGCAPAPFSGDQFIMPFFPIYWTHNDGLENAELFDGRREGHQALVIDGFTRLVGIGTNRLHRHTAQWPSLCVVVAATSTGVSFSGIRAPSPLPNPGFLAIHDLLC